MNRAPRTAALALACLALSCGTREPPPVDSTPAAPPTIVSFRASAEGVGWEDPVTITWTVTYADTIALEKIMAEGQRISIPGPLPTGTAQVDDVPRATATYALTASNAAGVATSQVRVVVWGSCPQSVNGSTTGAPCMLGPGQPATCYQQGFIVECRVTPPCGYTLEVPLSSGQRVATGKACDAGQGPCSGVEYCVRLPTTGGYTELTCTAAASTPDTNGLTCSATGAVCGAGTCGGP